MPKMSNVHESVHVNLAFEYAWMPEAHGLEGEHDQGIDIRMGISESLPACSEHFSQEPSDSINCAA